MSPELVLEIVRSSIWVMIKVSGPILTIALVVGLSISLIQALTQLQEMTLSFVPKILAIMLVMVMTMPFTFGILRTFTEDLYARIATTGVG